MHSGMTDFEKSGNKSYATSQGELDPHRFNVAPQERGLSESKQAGGVAAENFFLIVAT